MKKLVLRRQLKKHKTFLYNLTNGQAKSKIRKASKGELAVLSNIIFFISKGDIPIRAETVESLKQARKLKLFSLHFCSKEDFFSLLRNTGLQRNVLSALSNHLSNLLRPVVSRT